MERVRPGSHGSSFATVSSGRRAPLEKDGTLRIADDGKSLAFVRLSRDLPQVFVADTQTGATQLMSKNPRGSSPNGASTNPTLSSNGRFVAFQSEASNLVRDEDFNLLWDVFVLDRTNSEIVRVSGDAEGIWMEPSAGPSIDALGGVVAFSSKHPTDVSDKRNDFDLYIATYGGTHRHRSGDGPCRTVARTVRPG